MNGIIRWTCLIALLGTGCGTARYALLTVPAVSMTKPSFDASFKGAPSGHVESQYCRGDDPVSSKDLNVGLIDEAILKAQQQSGAQYLSDVTISRDGSCVFVEATAMK